MKPHLGIAAFGLLMLGLLPAVPVMAQGAATVVSAAQLGKAELPSAVEDAVRAGDYKKAYNELVKSLESQKITPDHPAALRAAMLLELIRVTDAEVMTKFAAGSKAKRLFLRQFALDPQWQEMYLSCGLVPYKTDVGLDVLSRIWRAEKGKVSNKKLAVALASAWGGGETDPAPGVQKQDPARFDPVWRYRFFEEQDAKGKLHKNYRRLQPWELRFVVGIPWQDWDDESFAWAANNINMPPDQYDWACWAAIYTDPSLFGDSVQSGQYGMPFSSESNAEATHRNGGVCGALSHLGTYAAMAHGIPAYTCGQPGHCAYAVRPERGKWIGGFGGPDGGMHNRIFGATAPTSFNLMEAVFASDLKAQQAYRSSFCARALEAVGRRAEAKAMWENALRSTPLHPFMRAELHRMLKAEGMTPQQAADYLLKLLPEYKGHGFAAADQVNQFMDLLKGVDEAKRMEVFLRLHEVIASTPSSWATKCDGILNSQTAGLSEDAVADFTADVIGCHMSKGDGAALGQTLEWAIKKYVEGAREGQDQIFADIFTKAATNSSASAVDVKDKDRANKIRESLGKAIIASEKAKSVTAFQAVANVADRLVPREDAGKQPTKLGEMRGKLAPATGMLRLSTTCRYDAPLQHRDVMTPKGGRFHTDAEQKPYAIVELKDGGVLTGCLIRKFDSYEGRMKRAVVYTSSDGATWMKRAETDNMPKEWVVTFPEGTEGKWVKVECDNGDTKNFMHLSHILIYKK